MSAPPSPEPSPNVPEEPLPANAPASAGAAFLYGLRIALTSVFCFVIAVTYIGFGALCHDFGLSVFWGMASTALLWAGPAQVILVTGIGVGATLETAIAVGLSSIRFLPIVVALVPMIRHERTKTWELLFTVHFWAISVWAEAQRHAPSVPREHRVAFCNGVGCGLVGVGVISTGIGYYLQAALPLLFGAAAMFITPISFLVSAARNARILLEKAALAFGLVVGSVLAYSRVEFDLLWTGIVAGTLAYGVSRWQRARKAAA